MTNSPPSEQIYFDLRCDSPATRLSTARDEGRCDWPFRGFAAEAVTPQRVADTFRSYLRSHPGIDHVVFTATGRPRSRPYLEAHVVDGCVHVQVVPLHTTDPATRAIVHHLHAAIVESFEHVQANMVEITTDAAGLGKWAYKVLAQAPADSAEAALARRALGLLRNDQSDASDTA